MHRQFCKSPKPNITSALSTILEVLHVDKPTDRQTDKNSKNNRRIFFEGSSKKDMLEEVIKLRTWGRRKGETEKRNN